VGGESAPMMAQRCAIPLPTSRFILSTAIRSRGGFPLAKLVVLFCVTTGAVLEVSIAAFKVSEWEMSRQLYARLQPEDVVVADSAYGTYVDLVLVQAAKADAVFRKHHARHCDFRRGKS